MFNKAAIGLTCLLVGCASVKSDLRGASFQTPMIDVRDVRALFVGDSITVNQPYAQNQRVAATSGATSDMIGRRFAAEIQQGTPRYVHILAGTNDFRSGDTSHTLENISGMVGEARTRHIPVIVGTVMPLDLILYPVAAPLIASFNQSLVLTVRAQGAFVADYFTAMILPNGLQNPALFSDGVHPNDDGYRVMRHVLREVRHEMRDLRYASRAADPERRTARHEARAEKHEARREARHEKRGR